MSNGLYDLFSSVPMPWYSNAEGTPRLAERVEVHRIDHRPELEGARVAIFGVQDGRRSGDNEGCAAGSEAIREALYRLTPHRNWQTTVDLGDLRPGVTTADTLAAVRSVASELIEMGIIPIVLGGGHDLTLGLYRALETLGQPVNLVTWDHRLDFGADPENTTARNYLNEIILHEPNYLFDYVNVGHQGYLTDPDTLDLMAQLQFDAHRLGAVHANPAAFEPILRDADLVSIDLGVVRAAEHPAHADAGPNGLDALQACQLGRYAGMSDRLKAVGIFEHNPDLDDRGRGAMLAAQLVWHILDGIFSQPADYPKCPKEDYTRYIVDLPDVRHEVVFYKSPRSDRWWMEVPFPAPGEKAEDRTLLVSCDYATYEEAMRGELPERWWRVFQKLG